MSEDPHVELAVRLRETHRRVAALELDDDEKCILVRRLLALTDASKRDAARAAVRLDRLLADLDTGRFAAADRSDDTA